MITLKKIDACKALKETSPPLELVVSKHIISQVDYVEDIAGWLAAHEFYKKYILWEFATQIFYRKSLGEKHPYYSAIYYPSETCSDILPVLSCFFKKVSPQYMYHKAAAQYVWLIRVQGIASTRNEWWQQMKIEEIYPPEAISLYIGGQCATDCCEEALFKVEIDDKKNCLDNMQHSSLNFLLESEYIKAISISSLSLVHCKRSSIVQYIAYCKKNVYIHVDKSNSSTQFQKWLCWR